jgi:hypothetical protein
VRVGFYGNTNNYPFMLAIALRRRGHEIVFVVDDEAPLHRPESRYNDIDARNSAWIVDESPVRIRHLVLPSRRKLRVLQRLRRCQAVVLNGYGPSLLPALRRPAIAFLTGSDLESFANPANVAPLSTGSGMHPLSPRRFFAKRSIERLVSLQRRGISLAQTIAYFPPGVVELGDRLLRDMGVTDDRRVFFYMTDTHAIRQSPPPLNLHPRVLCVARLNWKRPMRPGASQLDYKGSDVMIQGLAEYVRKSGRLLEIHLVRKGWDVRETSELGEAVGLGKLIVWHDEMEQAQLLDLVRSMDIVFDQVGEAFPGMGALDSLAIGRPVITNWRAELFPMNAIPVEANCQASTPAEVCAQLERLLATTDALVHASHASRAIAEKRFSSDAAAEICERRLASSAQPEGLAALA